MDNLAKNSTRNRTANRETTMKVKGKDLKAGTIMTSGEEVISAVPFRGKLSVLLNDPKTDKNRETTWGLNSTLMVKSVPTPS